MRGERVHGLQPECLRAGRAGSSGDGRKVRALEVLGEGPGRVRAIQRVGTLGTGLDSRAVGSGKVGRSGGRKFRAEAGSSGLSRSLSLLLLPSPLPCMALVLGSSMVVSVVPEYMQGPCMR